MARRGRKLTKKELKEDEFAEFVEEGILYAKHHARRIVGVLIVVIVVAIAVTFSIRQRQAAEAEAQGILTRGSFDFKQGNYAAALRSYSLLTERYRGTWSAADAIFFAANTNYATARYDSAMVLFNQYLNQGKRREELTVSAKNGIAQCLEELGRYGDAAANYLKTYQEHPDNVFAKDVLLGAARAYNLAGNINRAMEVYEDVMELYPDSREAELAKTQLLELQAKSERGS